MVAGAQYHYVDPDTGLWVPLDYVSSVGGATMDTPLVLHGPNGEIGRLEPSFWNANDLAVLAKTSLWMTAQFGNAVVEAPEGGVILTAKAGATSVEIRDGGIFGTAYAQWNMAGNRLTNETLHDVALNKGVRFKNGVNERVVGLRTTSGGTIGIGAHDGAGVVQPFAVGNANVAEHAVNRSYLEATTTAAFGYQDAWYEYGGAFGSTQLRKAADGMVTVEGIFRHAGKAMTAGATYQLATVPVGFRPAFQVLAAGNATYQAVRIDVMTTGVVTIAPAVAVTATYASFAGCSWKAA